MTAKRPAGPPAKTQLEELDDPELDDPELDDPEEEPDPDAPAGVLLGEEDELDDPEEPLEPSEEEPLVGFSLALAAARESVR